MLALLLFSAWSVLAEESEWKYCIVIDGGTTGTRLQAYKWEPVSNGVIKPIPILEGEKLDKPFHLAYYKPELITEIFDGLKTQALQDAFQAIDRSKVPIYCYSTSGMRGIEAYAREKVLSETRKYLKQAVFWKDFLIEDKNIATLTPQEEGIYAWIAVNALNGVFENGYPTVPITDIGSQSSQIVISGFESTAVLDRFTYDVAIDKHYRVYCYSFPHLGVDEIEENYTNSLAQDAGKATIESPCYRKASHTLGYLDIEGTGGKEGSYEKCRKELVKYSMRRGSSCNSSFCSFETIPMPYDLIDRHVHALSVHTYAYTSGLALQGTTLSTRENDAKLICDSSLSQIKQNQPGFANDKSDEEIEKELQKYCFQLTVSHIWLKEGLGLKDGDEVMRMNTKEVNYYGETKTVTVGWPYGAIIGKTSAAIREWEPEDDGFNPALMAVAAVVAVIILIGAITLVIWRRKKKDEKEGNVYRQLYRKAHKDKSDSEDIEEQP